MLKSLCGHINNQHSILCSVVLVPQVLLNIHNDEVVIGIALTEESLHRRNISHFGPTTLRSTLCYGMLR